MKLPRKGATRNVRRAIWDRRGRATRAALAQFDLARAAARRDILRLEVAINRLGLRIEEARAAFDNELAESYTKELKGGADMRHFYVSVVDGTRTGLLAGPFSTHKEALDLVDIARELAQEADPFACFYAYGTLSMAAGTRQGVLNKALDIIS